MFTVNRKLILGIILSCISVFADTAPLNSASSSGIVDFYFDTNASGSSVPKVYVDIAKIQVEVNSILGYFPRTKMTQQCFGASTDICPVNVTQCNSTMETPTCPTGGALNTTRHMCQASPTIVCGTNYTFDPTTQRCVQGVACPVGAYNTTSNQCEVAYANACDTANGYAYNSTRLQCEKAPPSCPNASSYNNTTNRCEGSSACVSPAVWNSTTQTCNSGGSYTYAATANNSSWSYGASGTWTSCSFYTTNMVTGQFMFSNTSPAGTDLTSLGRFSWNWGISSTTHFDGGCALAYTSGSFIPSFTVYPGASQKTYLANWNGWIYNTSTPTYTCPSGGTLSGTTCTVSSTYYTCPSGGTLSGTTCTVNTFTQVAGSCAAGLTPDATTGKCVANPTCPVSTGWSSTFDGTNDVCFTAPQKVCPTSTTYSSTSNICTSIPPCPNGTLDTTADVCVSTVTYTCVVGYIYNGAPINMCEAVPICLNGVFQPSNNQCYLGDLSCPIGNFPCHLSSSSGTDRWCSPYGCSAGQCGVASCPDLASAQAAISDPTACSAVACDMASPYNGYCGKQTCPTGFGVYTLNGKCYQDVCPSGSIQQADGSCQQLQCPAGSTEVNGICLVN